MNMNDRTNVLITLPHIRIQNANMISGPYTWGFPAVSNFLGFVHALQRKIGSNEFTFDGIGIVCHRFEPQVYQPSPFVPYQLKITRNPYGSDNKPSSTLEEGRIHLDVTLIIGVKALDTGKEALEKLTKNVIDTTQTMRIAGGSILPWRKGDRKPFFTVLSSMGEQKRDQIKKLKRKFLPGFVLTDRREILMERLVEMRENKPEATNLDALLDLCAVKVEPGMTPEQYEEKLADSKSKDIKVDWHFRRERSGWLVPIPVGFLPISELYEPGAVKNARDNDVPFRFVEAAYSLGEWLNPIKLEEPEDLMWYYESDLQKGTYLCKQYNKNKEENYGKN